MLIRKRKDWSLIAGAVALLLGGSRLKKTGG